MSDASIGKMIFTFVIIYFFFIMGKKLAENSYIHNDFPWIVTVFFFIIGIVMINDGSSAGYVALIPMLTYIFMKIFENSNRNIKGLFLGALGSVGIKIVATEVLAVGGSEALISSAISFGLYYLIAPTA